MATEPRTSTTRSLRDEKARAEPEYETELATA